MFILADVDCGTVSFPGELAHIIALVVNFIKIGIPILLIVWGMLDLGKAVIQQKEDDIKKGWKTFLSRLLAGLIVFFVITIVEFAINLVAGDSAGTISSCIDGILNA